MILTFASRPDDPAPLCYSVVDFLLPHLREPRTSRELLAILQDWHVPEGLPGPEKLTQLLIADERLIQYGKGRFILSESLTAYRETAREIYREKKRERDKGRKRKVRLS